MPHIWQLIGAQESSINTNYPQHPKHTETFAITAQTAGYSGLDCQDGEAVRSASLHVAGLHHDCLTVLSAGGARPST